jgi:iron complex transport system ATP-binding protein
VIDFHSVRVTYPGQPHAALDGVSLGAARGAITAVAGPNGSGKSTLVRALLGRVPLAGGAIVVDATPIGVLGARALARRVAFVTQREDTTFTRSVADYVALARFPHGDAGTATARRAIDDAVGRAGVEPLLARTIDTLSGGEWQRVRIARALAQGGDALVLDEPTSFLDVAHEMLVFELLAQVAATGVAVLLVSHQLNLVARFANRIVLLHHGRVAMDGSPDDVMRGDVLERVYEWPLVVSRDPAVGAPALVPLRRH